MSYLALPRANFRCDTLKITQRTSLSVGDEWSISDTPKNTRATLNNGKITIYSGSHWILQSKVGNQLFISSLSGEYRTQFHDGTNYVGFPAIMSNLNDLTCSTNFARAFILSSDITTSMTLSIKCSLASDTIEHWNTGSSLEPISTINIMELPL
tara:strand:- start:1125 stop:1586 length:462 start_codon:yes stop_codon:yes gene_type:complete